MTAALGVGVSLSLLDCRSGRDSEGVAPVAPKGVPAPASSEARARIATLRSHLSGAAHEPGSGLVWKHGAGAGLSAEGDDVDVEVPLQASGETTIRDRRSRMSVRVALEGAGAAAAQRSEDVLVYPAAGPEGSDVLVRAHAAGVEDYLYFARRPASTVVRYRIDVTAAAGLRMVGAALELLDGGGFPRLRVQPPHVLAADGARHPARLAIEGCDVDRDPRAPWGRALRPPGASACTLSVSWPEHGVAYPAFVDPEWVATANSMATARHRHSVSELTPGAPASIVLIAGGFDGAGNAIASAELYHPLERTFASTGALNVARGDHTATTMATLPVAPIPQNSPPVAVAIAGGSATLGAAGLASVEVYKPDTGTFVVDGNHTYAARVRHTATLIDNATMLLAGGYGSNPNIPLASASVYQLTGFDAGGSPLSNWSATGPMATARARHAAERLTASAGNVLVTGGLKDSVNANQGGEVYTPNAADPTLATFAPLPNNAGASQLMQVPRYDHRATRIADKEVLITGGTNGTVFYDAVDIYVDTGTVVGFAFQLIPITMSNARARHSATLLPNGKVVVAGGINGSGAVGSGEIFDPDPMVKSFTPLAVTTPMGPRSAHGGLLVNAGGSVDAGRGVLVVGGLDNGSVPLATAQVLLEPDGEGCVIDDDCGSGHCAPNDDASLNAPGICCDSDCNQLCVSCTAAGKGAGNDGACGFTAASTALPVTCVSEVEIHITCDGNGQVLTQEALDCKPSTCNAAGTACSQVCNGTGDCSMSGWCDLTTAPGTGGGGAGGSGGSAGGAGGGGAGGSGGGGGAAGAGGAGGSTPAGSCQPRRPLGTTCERDEQCLGAGNKIDLTGQCVDGFCCESTCTNQCQACDVDGNEGKCVAVPAGEQPHPNLTVEPGSGGAGGGAAVDEPRLPCAGAGSDCGGYCDGTDVLGCAFPDSTTQQGDPVCSCTEADCSVGPATVTRRVCDSMGSFQNVEQDCAGFRCDADAKECLPSCASDDDCVEDYLCDADSQQCVALTGPTCDGAQTLLRPMAPDVACAPYACPRGQSACLAACNSVDDCAAPAVCNGSGQCVQAPTSGSLKSCSCATVGAPTEPSEHAPWWLLTSLLALTLRRRRRVDA